jgi:hypothetical protein
MQGAGVTLAGIELLIDETPAQQTKSANPAVPEFRYLKIGSHFGLFCV